MSNYDVYWRNIILKIRNIYNGKLTDSASHDGEKYNKTWWYTIDFIGVIAYYLSIFTDKCRNNLTNIENIFDETIRNLKNLSETYLKRCDAIITEIGLC